MRAVILFCYAKKDRDNVSERELRDFRDLGQSLLQRDDDELADLIMKGEIELVETH